MCAQSRAHRRSITAALLTLAAAAALTLSGCGQNFSQDGGAIPAPTPSVNGDRHVTPAPADNQEKVIGPGYAPPRTAGPTQTAVPNLPGGKA
ncbi:hypothetical protein [Frankia sp. AiPa1]|uniref:hypothetical protein n=1 Tax=Frankia sp. AiPa1 TaxID=573492 RepID=UPI00202B618A|nr:hypothetical protein [Frankia sp. AiPa1]MCL9762569.1 hypothetical protein [Frankia sp. AiPa1]